MSELITLPAQAHCGPKQPSKTKFRQMRLHRGLRRDKPIYGFWTSTFETLEDIGWVGWCRAESYANPQEAWLLQPTPARVFEVRDSNDSLRLHEKYGILWGDLGPAFGEPDRYAGLDWDRLVQDYDAVRLVNPFECRFENHASTFYGWDAESTVWLRWCFVDEISRVALTPYEEPCRECRYEDDNYHCETCEGK